MVFKSLNFYFLSSLYYSVFTIFFNKFYYLVFPGASDNGWTKHDCRRHCNFRNGLNPCSYCSLQHAERVLDRRNSIKAWKRTGCFFVPSWSIPFAPVHCNVGFVPSRAKIWHKTPRSRPQCKCQQTVLVYFRCQSTSTTKIETSLQTASQLWATGMFQGGSSPCPSFSNLSSAFLNVHPETNELQAQ
jgi:hypothetical protein